MNWFAFSSLNFDWSLSLVHSERRNHPKHGNAWYNNRDLSRVIFSPLPKYFWSWKKLFIEKKRKQAKRLPSVCASSQQQQQVHFVDKEIDWLLLDTLVRRIVKETKKNWFTKERPTIAQRGTQQLIQNKSYDHYAEKQQQQTYKLKNTRKQSRGIIGVKTNTFSNKQWPQLLLHQIVTPIKVVVRME